MDAEQKVQAFENLLNEISTTIVDLTAAAHSNSVSASEISQTLVEMLGLMEKRGAADTPAEFKKIADAIRDIKINVSAPQVTVKNEVKVAPADVVIQKPQIKHWDFKHTYKDDKIIGTVATPVYEGQK